MNLSKIKPRKLPTLFLLSDGLTFEFSSPSVQHSLKYSGLFLMPNHLPVSLIVTQTPSIGWIKSSWILSNCNKTLKVSHRANIFGLGVIQLFETCWCKFHFDDVNSDVTVANHVQIHIFSIQVAAARHNVLSRC